MLIACDMAGITWNCCHLSACSVGVNMHPPPPPHEHPQKEKKKNNDNTVVEIHWWKLYQNNCKIIGRLGDSHNLAG